VCGRDVCAVRTASIKAEDAIVTGRPRLLAFVDSPNVVGVVHVPQQPDYHNDPAIDVSTKSEDEDEGFGGGGGGRRTGGLSSLGLGPLAVVPDRVAQRRPCSYKADTRALQVGRQHAKGKAKAKAKVVARSPPTYDRAFLPPWSLDAVQQDMNGT
jgi:hypothetical protein